MLLSLRPWATNRRPDRALLESLPERNVAPRETPAEVRPAIPAEASTSPTAALQDYRQLSVTT